MIESLCKAISSILKHFEMNTTKISSKNMEESNVAIYLHNNNITYSYSMSFYKGHEYEASYYNSDYM